MNVAPIATRVVESNAAPNQPATSRPNVSMRSGKVTCVSSGRSFSTLPAGACRMSLLLCSGDNHVTLPMQIAAFERVVIGWFGATFTKP